MYTTYYIETLDNYAIFAYYDRLYAAKSDLVKLNPNIARIVCLKGQYRYEGQHAYSITYNGKRFKRLKGYQNV